MTAFADFLDLRVAIAEALARPDITDKIPQFVKMAEVTFNSELRSLDMEKTATLTFTNGLAPLPADFLEVLTPWAGATIALNGATRRAARLRKAGMSINGSNAYIDGLYGVTRELEYFAAIPTITNGPAGTNWLLQKAPNLYLYGAALEGAKWTRDEKLIAGFAAFREKARYDFVVSDERARFGNVSIMVG